MSCKNKEVAYFLARMAMGVNLLGHGLARLPKLGEFKTWMLGYFQDTLLPELLVGLWASVLPFLEFGLGILIIAGLFTKKALAGGAVVIVILIFGSCLKENWEWVGIQMIYAMYFFFLSLYIDYNQLSVDNKLFKPKKL